MSRKLTKSGVQRHTYEGTSGARAGEKKPRRDRSRSSIDPSPLLHPLSTSSVREFLFNFAQVSQSLCFSALSDDIRSLVSQAGTGGTSTQRQATAAQQRSHRDEHRAQIIATNELLEMPASPMNR